MTKKIIIVLITLFIAGFIIGVSTAEAMTPEREQFLCSVGVFECFPIESTDYIEVMESIDEPLQVKRAPAPMISATSTEVALIEQKHREQLLDIIAQLTALLEILKSRQHAV